MKTEKIKGYESELKRMAKESEILTGNEERLLCSFFGVSKNMLRCDFHKMVSERYYRLWMDEQEGEKK